MGESKHYGAISNSYGQDNLSTVNDFPLMNTNIEEIRNFTLENCLFDYEPYPIGQVKNIFPQAMFADLCTTFPEESLLKHFPSSGDKYLLSEGSDPAAYFSHLNKFPAWKKLFELIKTASFIQYLNTFLKQNNIDLGINDLPILFPKPDELLSVRYVTSRFEFGSLPTKGGYHIPHTDISKKIVSLVISMTPDEVWYDPTIGGMSVCWPKRKDLSFNYINKPLPLEQVDIIRKYSFNANCGVIFPKTFNSWHCVEPVYNLNCSFRRTIVIQLIESK